MRKISFTLAATMLAPCLFAVDGVVLINQSTVVAAGGFPYKITQPGSYKLSGNLTVPDANTTAISIASVNVTLDLNGFGIIGPVVCTYDIFSATPTTSCSSPASSGGYGVENSGTRCGFAAGSTCPVSGDSVINGTVRGMGSIGIVLYGGTVRNVLAISNASTGIYIVAGAVIDSTASLNGSHGIEGSGVLSGNTAFNNVSFGLFVSCPSSVVGNTAFGNSQNLFIFGSNCAVANNAAP